MTTHQVARATDKAALYIYCVARAKSDRVLGPIGLEDKPVYTVIAADICAVVHDCRPEPYQSDVPEIAQDWVVAHQRIVCAAEETFGTVLPMAFNMIVHGDAKDDAVSNLQSWLVEKQNEFTRLLDKLIGKSEYGAQIFWDRQLVAELLVQRDPELREMRDEALKKPKGLAYMLQQKLTKATREAVATQANSYVDDFYTRIRQCVSDVRVEKLKKQDGGERMLLNLSCLMEKGAPALGNVLEEIQKTEGISVRFTGPWPPYSFVNAG